MEGVNDPITPIAEQIFHAKRGLVLPNILTMVGSAISSYAEYSMNTPEMAFSLIESRIREMTRDVVKRSLESGIPLRRITKEIAKERILEAREAVL